jgi:hypothetical protein
VPLRQRILSSADSPSVVGRNWRLNAREWPIPVMNLRKVVPLSFLRIVDNNLI